MFKHAMKVMKKFFGANPKKIEIYEIQMSFKETMAAIFSVRQMTKKYKKNWKVNYILSSLIYFRESLQLCSKESDLMDI